MSCYTMGKAGSWNMQNLRRILNKRQQFWPIITCIYRQVR